MKTKILAVIIILSVLFVTACTKKSSETPAPVPPDPPVTASITAEFSSDKSNIYQGESIQFSNASKGTPDAYAWTFEEGTPASSTEENPLVQFKTPGSHAVKLVVTKGSEKSTKSSSVNAQVFSIELPPKVTILNSDSSFNFSAVYPANTTHTIQYSALPNTGTFSGANYTAPSTVTSQKISIKANSALLPAIESTAEAYIVGSNDFTGKGTYETYRKNEIMLENNLWNVGLARQTFSRTPINSILMARIILDGKWNILKQPPV